MRCLHVDCLGVMGRLSVAVGGCGDLYVTRCWCAQVMVLRVLSSQVPLPLRVRQGPCLGREVLDCSSFEGVCVLQSKVLEWSEVSVGCACKWFYLCVCMVWIKYLASKVLAVCLGLSTRRWLVLVGLHGTCSATEGSGPGIPTIPLLIANSKCTDHSPPISSTELQIQWCEQKLESMHRTLCTSLRFVQFWTRLLSCNLWSTNWESDL